MPMFDYVCEVCGHEGRGWRQDKPPRFCCRACQRKGKFVSGKRKYIITPEMHTVIRRVYQGDTGNGEIRDLAVRLGLPRWKLTRYAGEQGWINRSRREPEWTERELGILERSAHRCPAVIQRHLARIGVKRSETGIVLKRKRMRFLANLQGHSARDVAGCFGVDEHTVIRWVKLGYLDASRRGTARSEVQGGDMYWIKDEAIRDFVVSTVSEIDFRKVDKFWLVDLLAGIKTFTAESAENAERKGEESGQVVDGVSMNGVN